jgi:hypothetical protein
VAYLYLVDLMQRVVLALALLVALTASASEKVPRDPEHMCIYEIALRHFLAVRHAPPNATVLVSIGGAPAPAELIERFRGSQPRVRAAEKDVSIPSRYYCAMMLGADYGHECYLVVWGYAHDVLHHYHFKKRGGEWQLLSDEVAYLDG